MTFRTFCLGLMMSSASTLAFSETVEIGSDAFNEAVRNYLLENPEVIFEAVDIYNERQEQAEAGAAKDNILKNQDKIYAEENAIIVGDPKAEFAVVEFIDYNCGYCRKSHAELNVLKEEEPDVKFLVRQLPILSQGSLEASKIVLAVKELYGDEAALNLHNQIYDELQEANQSTVLELTQAAGHDNEAILEAAEGQGVYNALAQSHELAELLKITGTPGFIIGDELIGGYLPADTMQQIIDAKKQAS